MRIAPLEVEEIKVDAPEFPVNAKIIKQPNAHVFLRANGVRIQITVTHELKREHRELFLEACFQAQIANKLLQIVLVEDGTNIEGELKINP